MAQVQVAGHSVKMLSRRLAARAASLDLSRAVAGYAASVGEDNDLSLLLVLPDRLRLVADDDALVDLPLSAITNVAMWASGNVTAFSVSSNDDVRMTLKLYSESDGKDLAERLAAAGLGLTSPKTQAPLRPKIPRERMVTTLQFPGQRITQVLGAVSELSAASGFTAGMKGNQALSSAFDRLAESAHALGANAIVGLTGSPFGAGGGITSAFGGDAVGILLLGTAVAVEPIPAM